MRLSPLLPFATAASRVAGSLATPLLPADFLDLIDPLRSGGELRARVERVRRETPDATSLALRPGRGWAGHRSGQYLLLGLDVDGVRTWRTYSISTPPGSPLVTITVKALPDGLVSRRLAHETGPGEIVRLGRAAGDFVLPEVPGPLLFVTAGSGITPVAAMLRELAAGGERLDVVLVHSAPTPAEVILGPQLRRLARLPGIRLHEHHTRPPGSPGRLTAAGVAALCPDWAGRTTYACGPAALLSDLAGYWDQRGQSARLLVERFHTPTRDAGGAARGGRVRFTRSGVRTPANGRTSLLDVGEQAGVLMPSGCRQGICHTCLAPLRAGRVRDLRTGREHGEPGDLVQTCVSAAVGTVEIDL